MKFYRLHNAWITESKTAVAWAGFTASGMEGYRNAKAAAFFPFVFVRSREYATPIFINHKRIHFRQQIELLFVGLYAISVFEKIYARLFLRLSPAESYLYLAAEQEAYRNQHNFEYLDNRPLFAMLRYTLDKRKIAFIPNQAPEVCAITVTLVKYLYVRKIWFLGFNTYWFFCATPP